MGRRHAGDHDADGNNHRLHLGRRRHQLRQDRRGRRRFHLRIAETREGVRIKLHSKVDALHKLGLELGMFKQGVKVGGDADNPLVALVQSIQGSALPLGFQQPQAQPQSQLIHASSSRPAPRPRPLAPPPSRRCWPQEDWSRARPTWRQLATNRVWARQRH